MSKPKNKPNAFSVFCKDWRKKEEKNNRFFTLAEAISNPDCNRAWRDLPEDQKTRYKTLAKNAKFHVEPDKKTGLGESLNEVERVERKKKEFSDNMKEYIASTIRAAKESDSIQKLSFYILHTNFLYSRTLGNHEVEYYPAEICVARCSLGNGVEAVHHVLVSETVMIGYKNDAITHSKDTHQIPINFDEGERDYRKIFKGLCKFMEPGKSNNRLPPLYTIRAKEDIYYPAQSILDKLAAATDQDDECTRHPEIRLYAFEELFASIYNAVQDQTDTIGIESLTAAQQIIKDPHGYKNGLECEFHKAVEAGALHCSQSIVKRWFYVLCDFCCDYLNIIRIPGVHAPMEKEKPILPLSRLNSSFSSISLNDSRYSSTMNMSDVSHEYRMRSSGRLVQEKLRRKAETSTAKPIQIIDHSKMTRKLPEVKERPLRLPYSKSTCANDDDNTVDNKSLDYSEHSFPSIGRGSAPRKRTQEKKGSAGHGYANALKS